MTYQANIPLATDLISDSQQDLNDNFSAIKTTFDVNHETFNAVNTGKHKWVTCPEQANSPGTAVNEVAIYSKQSGAGVSELFLQRENIAPAGADIQMTLGTPLSAANGSSFLPGGIKIIWGGIAAAVGANVVVFPDSGFPNTLFSVTLGTFNTSSSQQATFENASRTQITIYSSAIQTVFYMAIGN